MAQDTTLTEEDIRRFCQRGGMTLADSYNYWKIFEATVAGTAPYQVVNLAAQPHNVVPGVNTLTQKQANTAAINAAIVAYSGTKTTLLLPPGEIFLEQYAGDGLGYNNCAIYVGPGTSDVTIKGAGKFATTLVVDATSDNGELHNIAVRATDNGSVQRVTLCDFGLRQDRIANPDAAQLNHLIRVSNEGTTGTILCDTVYGQNLAFYKAIGDGIYFAGNGTYTVSRSRWDNLTMQLNGAVTGGPYAAARNGISIQRGHEDLFISNFMIQGFKNCGLDTESTGAGTRKRVVLVNGTIDASHTATAAAVAFTLESAEPSEPATDYVVRNVTVLRGKTEIATTQGLDIDGLKIRVDSTFAADGTDSAFQVRLANNDMRIRNLDIERNGGTAGKCFDMENTGNRTYIEGMRLKQATVARPGVINGSPGGLDIVNTVIHYAAGSGASSFDALEIQAINNNVDTLTVDNMRVYTTTGTLNGALRLTVRDPRSLTNVIVSNIQAQGEATNAVIYSIGTTGAPVPDAYPMFNNLRAGVEYIIVDQSDNPLADTVWPRKAAGIANVYEGNGSPENKVTAVVGSIYNRLNGGAGTSIYIKESGTGNTGWVAK